MTVSRPSNGFWRRIADSPELLAAIGVVVAALAMIGWTWGTWPDPVNDSGRELYVAWQLAAGKVLYRDIAYFNGPLSPYINAAWFAIVGPGIAKLEVLNAVILAAIAGLTWHLIRRVAGWAAAAATVLVFVTLFAFGPLTTIGSFSYLLPYSHEMTHGLLLLLLFLAVLDRFGESGGPGRVVLLGFLLGLMFLTKPEIVIAGCTAAGIGFALTARRRRRARRAATYASFLLGVIVPPLAGWAALASIMPGEVASQGLLGSWAHLTNRAIGAMPYFRMFMGIDRPLASAVAITGWTAAWGAAIALSIVAGRALVRLGRFERPTAALLTATVATFLVAARELIPWRDAFRPLPVVCIALLCWAVIAERARSDDDPSRPPLVLAAAASGMSLMLMLKMILFARVWHYGFVLGMPAAMIAVAAGSRGIRSATRARGGSPWIAGSVMTGFMLGMIGIHLVSMEETIATRNVPVGRGSDAFRSDQRGRVIGAALGALEELAPTDATLAVLPDGVMLSYLARRPNSTPYVIGNPVDVEIFGEARMLDAYRAHPPDYFALLKCDTSIYGFPGFGQGYAEQLDRWIEANYQPIGVARPDDAGDNSFLAVVLKHRAP